MTQITDLFTQAQLEYNLLQGLVREQSHPEFPNLRILNYTEAAQFGRQWNEVTKVCRGLIYNAETGEILARPFAKIHNWDESEAPPITWEAPLYHWGNKEDGSLGIVYLRPDARWGVATRGSFASEQAIHATNLVWGGQAYIDVDMIHAGHTQLFEIIYPENRIVLDYGTLDKLIPLGFIHNDTGAYVPDTTARSERRTFAEIMQDLNRENAEGWVVWLDEYKAVKVKQADYVELHRMVTGLNRKSVWRAMQEGSYKALLKNLPDELYAWAEGVFNELLEERNSLIKRADQYFMAAGAWDGSQKEFALNVQEQVPRYMQGLVFSLRAGKNILPAIYKMIEPKGGER